MSKYFHIRCAKDIFRKEELDIGDMAQEETGTIPSYASSVLRKSSACKPPE